MAVLKTTAILDTKQFISSIDKIKQSGMKVSKEFSKEFEKIKPKVKLNTSKINADSKRAGKRAGESFKGGFKSVAIGAAIGSLAIGGLRKIVASFTELRKLAAVQEEAENKLKSALLNTGDASKSTFENLKKQASAIQKITTVGDEASLGLMQLGLSMGITSDKITEATKGSIGLSKSLGIDMKSAMKMVALAGQGDYTMLQRYIPALRSTKDATKKAAIVQKALANGFIIAQKETETSAGKLKQMNNTIGDFKEKLGQVINIIMAFFAPAISFIVNNIEILIPVIAGLGVVVYSLVAPLIAAKIATLSLNVAILANPFVWIAVAVGAFVAGLIYAYKNVDWFKLLINKLWEQIKILAGYIWEGIKIWWDWINPVGLAINLFTILYEKVGWFKDAVDAVVGAVKGAIKWFTDLVGIGGKEVKQMKKQEDQTKKLEQAKKSQNEELKKSADILEKVTKGIQDHKTEIKATTSALATAKTVYGENSEQAKILQEKLDKLNGTVKKVGSISRKTVKSLSALKTEFVNLSLLGKSTQKIFAEIFVKTKLNIEKQKIAKDLKTKIQNAIDEEEKQEFVARLSKIELKPNEIKISLPSNISKQGEEIAKGAIAGLQQGFAEKPIISEKEIAKQLKAIPTEFEQMAAGLEKTAAKAGITTKTLTMDLQNSVSAMTQAALSNQKSFGSAMGKMALTQIEKMIPLWVASIFGVEAGTKGLVALVTVPIITGLLIGLVEKAKSSFKEGGYTGNMNPNQIAGVVHGQEFVMPEPQTKKYRHILENMKSGKEIDVNGRIISRQTKNEFQFEHKFNEVKIDSHTLSWHLNDLRQQEIAGF